MKINDEWSHAKWNFAYWLIEQNEYSRPRLMWSSETFF